MTHNISGRLHIWCLPWGLHINCLLPSEHHQDSHAENAGRGISELSQCFPPFAEGARCLGDVQGGACELYALLHVLGHHQHELLLASWPSQQLINMILSWRRKSLMNTSDELWRPAEPYLVRCCQWYFHYPMPMPYCAVISLHGESVWTFAGWHPSINCCDISRVESNYIVRIENPEKKNEFTVTKPQHLLLYPQPALKLERAVVLGIGTPVSFEFSTHFHSWKEQLRTSFGEVLSLEVEDNYYPGVLQGLESRLWAVLPSSIIVISL